MGYADRVPNRDVMSEHQRVPRVVPILGSTDDHLAAALLARFECARSRWWAGSGLRRPAVESSRGVMPTQAAKRRPERKALASGTSSAKLTPPIGPIPGIVAKHW